ncbi:hypothetical protein HPP92_017976 [Vanilla planifolia]|uniref:Glycosyltransferase n=1 Tax=Vanilla planifolia TaxID=51239 RepID=A0A835QH46_VANPL|nr:hypothetical protein HPP92_017976 [Vanilla planifolia]
MANGGERDHVVLFPFLSKGHMLPLLHFASSLSSRGVVVSIITTPANVPFILHHLPQPSDAKPIRVLPIPFPSGHFQAGIESTDSLPSISLFPAFLSASFFLRSSFLRILLRLLRSGSSPPPLCLVSDFFFGWTQPLCRRLSLPRIVFHGMSPFSMSIIKSLWGPNLPSLDSVQVTVPGAPESFRIAMADLPDTVLASANPLDPQTVFLESIGSTDLESWGVLVNSFAELEPDSFLDLFESFYRRTSGGRAWLVGPLALLVDSPRAPVADYLQWLDRQPVGSVVYVAFGTQADLPKGQLDEVAHGLARAGVRFLWVIRSTDWSPPPELEAEMGPGRIEKGWVSQREVLLHVAVGGFVSHCGWNSLLEAVADGVPVLGWPMIAEQRLNARMVEEELGMGMRMAGNGRKEVEEGVKELMEGDKGSRTRARARELARKARAAVVEGGSSYTALEKLLEELRRVSNVNRKDIIIKMEEEEGEDEKEIDDDDDKKVELDVAEVERKMINLEIIDGISQIIY